MKMMELAEMAKLTALIKEGSTTRFMLDWKSFIEYVQEMEKDDIYVCGFLS